MVNELSWLRGWASPRCPLHLYNDKRDRFGNLHNSERSIFHPELVCASLVVEEAALKQGFLQVHRFSNCHYFSNNAT